MKEIKLNQLVSFLKEGKSIKNIQLNEDLDLRILMINEKESIETKIDFENCTFKKVNAFFLTFREKLNFHDCKFESINFQSCFFEKQVTIIDSKFNEEINIESCGFFEKITVENNTFFESCNFFDCNFKSKFTFQNNELKKGTNLFKDKKTTFNKFDIPFSGKDDTTDI